MYTESELVNKHQAAKNINTTRSDDRANSAFQKFLGELGKEDLRYWLYEEEELDIALEKFWFGARKSPDEECESDPEDPQKVSLMYSANTMRNFRYGLNRILKSKGHNYDIISPSNLSFRRSQHAFLASQKELKDLGKAQVHSAPEITEDGKHCFLIVIVSENSSKKMCRNFPFHVSSKFSVHRSQTQKSKMAYQSSINSLIFGHILYKRFCITKEKYGCI